MTVETFAVVEALAVAAPQPVDLPRAVLVGDLRTGRIFTELDATTYPWKRVLDGAGSIEAIIPEAVVRAVGARSAAAPAKCFLAVEVGQRIMQAGPIWSHSGSRRSGQLRIGAAGLWSLFDHRMVLPVLAAGVRFTAPAADTTVSGTTLGGIARALVAQAMTHTGGELPLVLPAAPAGSTQETFLGHELPTLGEQLRQLTRRATGAPNIRFTARRRPGDPRFLEWVMEIGSEAQPQLVQPGADWYFDDTVPASPVVDIGYDVDASAMGTRGHGSGSGSGSDMLASTHDDPTLTDLGYPLLEVEESHPTVGSTIPPEEGAARTAAIAQSQATLDGHTANLVARRGRPVEKWDVIVRADDPAARQVSEGDYCRLVVEGDAYIPDGEHRCRALAISGDHGDELTLSMAPTPQEV